MSKRDEYYDRIRKITGDHLFDNTIGIYNAPFVSKAVELLVSCGVLGIAFCDATVADNLIANVWNVDSGEVFEDALARRMKEHNQLEDRWRFIYGEQADKEQVILAGGSFDACEKAYIKGRENNVPVIIGLLFANGTSAVSVVLPGGDFPFYSNRENIVPADASRYFDWIDLNNQIANIAKAILLEGTEWHRNDIMTLLHSGMNSALLAHPEWPWVSRYVDTRQGEDLRWLKDVTNNADNSASNISAEYAGKKVMIVGLGSLGGVVGEHFRVLGCNVIGIDGKDVSIHNPVRQIYSTSEIGLDKSEAFVRILLQSRNPNQWFVGIKKDIPDSRIGSKSFSEILEQYSPDLVVLATAHQAEYRMADICRQKNIPHVIGRCYNRAQWFEVTVVNGNQGPCFGCLQGHLYKGAPPSLTEEQLARYDMAGDEANVVQAEPATRVDTARCADVMARFGAQLLRKPEARARWLAKMLEEERTCLIGGNFAEHNDETDEWSFGVTVPGGVALYGVINFIGSETENEKNCIYCGKKHKVFIKRRKFTQ